MSVPVLWDRSTRRIVSNNFPDITIDLGTEFEQWADASVDLCPIGLRPAIDTLNQYVYETVNNGTYRVAGATTEADYQRPRRQLTAAFAELDERLAHRRFLFGASITEADVRLWPTLARFDLGYNPLGKISERPLTSYPNLWGYARDLYQHPAFRDTTDFTTIATFATGPRPSFFNDAPWRIEVEPNHADWEEPTERDAL